MKKIIFIPFLLISVCSVYCIAGRTDWIELNIFFGTYFCVLIGWIIYLKLKAPDLLKERLTAGKKAKKFDRKVIPIYLFIIFLFYATAAFDAGRLQFSTVPNILKIISFPIILICFALSLWAGVTNKYLSSHVRIQTDRGHTVIETGPYRIVRHPMYTGIVISYPFISLFLVSYFALVPALMVIVLFIIRTSLEDKTLQNEL